MEILHNSYQREFRRPFGAVSCGSTLVLGLKVNSRAAPEKVLVHIWTKAGGQELPMVCIDTQGQSRFYRLKMKVPEQPGLLWYYFSIRQWDRTVYYGNNSEETGGTGRMSPKVPPGYQVTVYLNENQTPHWFKDTIVYQIYTDRFFNGSPDGQVQNPYPKSLLHTSWDDVPFYIRDPETRKVIRWDFFGGNLSGVLAKLPYLEELGVGCLYFNPVFQSSSNHKYDTGDYKNIDPMYGDNELFARLCREAAARGMSVILDGVFSHTGSDSIYFNKEGNYPGPGAYRSRESPYYPWYRFMEYPDRYDSWWGVESLPCVDEMEPSYQKFILDDPDSVVKHWMGMGVKGWRLDVADELPDPFIKKLRAVVKKTDPEAVVLGEVWEDASNKVSYGMRRGYLYGDELDSVTNYPFRNILVDFLLGKKSAGTAIRQWMSIYENYPRVNFYALLNLTGSHDVPRILTLLGEAPTEETLSEWEKALFRLSPANRELGLRRMQLFALVQMTFPGVPGLYYGDEVGMEGYRDPYNRGTFPWGREDRPLLEWYCRLVRLRKHHMCLRTGEFFFLPAHDDILCFGRYISDGQDVFGRAGKNSFFLILVNRHRDSSRSVELDLKGSGCPKVPENIRDVEAEETKIILPDGILRLTLKPLEGKIFIAEAGENDAG